MKVKTFAKSFVVTVAMTACSRETTGTSNPPGPDPTPKVPTTGAAPTNTKGATRKRTRTGPAAAGSAYAREPSWSDTEPKNPRDPVSGKPIFVSTDDTCFFEQPMKDPPKDMPTGSRAVDAVAVDCPKELDDPAWDHCAWGHLQKHKNKPECFCGPLAGNPPPPPRVVPCPK